VVQACVRLGFAPIQSLTTRKQRIGILVLSQTFSASIVMGIWALKYIPVSFDQVRGGPLPHTTRASTYALPGPGVAPPTAAGVLRDDALVGATLACPP
jgi:hypothetical protein